MGRKVVGGNGHSFVLCKYLEVLNKQVCFEGIGVIKVDLGTFVW